MPGFDGTGPAGLGPRTGGGRGFCPPMGLGVRGYGRSSYRGWHRWQPWHPYAMSYPPRLAREEEIDYLRSEADIIKSQLNEIELRIQELAGIS